MVLSYLEGHHSPMNEKWISCNHVIVNSVVAKNILLIFFTLKSAYFAKKKICMTRIDKSDGFPVMMLIASWYHDSPNHEIERKIYFLFNERQKKFISTIWWIRSRNHVMIISVTFRLSIPCFSRNCRCHLFLTKCWWGVMLWSNRKCRAIFLFQCLTVTLLFPPWRLPTSWRLLII